MNNEVILSIVTVVYNGEKTIEKTVLSVVSQNLTSIEYIVIDGGSTDSTMSVVNKYKENISVIISEEDCGVYDAMNKATSMANGLWILFLNSGDVFYSVNTLSLFLQNIPVLNYDVIYGDTLYQYNNYDILVGAKNVEYMEKGMPFCHQSVFVKTRLLKDNKFDLSFRLASDYNFFYNLYKNQCAFLYIPLCISVYSLSGGLSDSNVVALYKEYLRVRCHSRVRSNFFIIYLRFRSFLPHTLRDILRRFLYRFQF